MSNVKNYTVKDFCDKFNKLNVAEAKGALIASVMNIHYVPYETKITICKNIVNITYYNKTNKNGIEVKKLHIDSPSNYMLYCLNLVKQYTNIEIDFKKSLEEFNMLNGCEVLDLIYSEIPERELKEFRMILDMVESDVMQNEYEPHAFISNQVERFGELFGNIAKPAFDRLSEILKNMDEESVDKTIDKLKELNIFNKKFNIIK